MMEIMFAGGQILSTAGLLYGAWLAIAYTEWTKPRLRPARERRAWDSDPEEIAVWRNYLACDV